MSAGLVVLADVLAPVVIEAGRGRIVVVRLVVVVGGAVVGRAVEAEVEAGLGFRDRRIGRRVGLGNARTERERGDGGGDKQLGFHRWGTHWLGDSTAIACLN